MLDLSQDYINAATSSSREYSVKMEVTWVSAESETAGIHKAEYIDKGIMAMKIVQGQTTGGFTLGGTACATLTMTCSNDVEFPIPGKRNDGFVKIYIRFKSENSYTEWNSLGVFNLDEIKKGIYSQSVVAHDDMYRYTKNYVPENYKNYVQYPISVKNLLTTQNSGLPHIAESYSIINGNAIIQTAPLLHKAESKDDEDEYYTVREILGYLAAINGGGAYIDPIDYNIRFSLPKETFYTIPASSVISLAANITDFYVQNIIWETDEGTYGLSTDFVPNTVELISPLDYDNEQQIMNNVQQKLIDFKYDAVTIKKQGTGMFQLGDIIHYHPSNNEEYKIFVMGIVYDFSNGFFSETLYSLANSESRQEYQRGTSVKKQVIISEPENFTDSQLLIAFKRDVVSDEVITERIEIEE